MASYDRANHSLDTYNEVHYLISLSDDTLALYELADRVAELIQYVPEPSDLPPITNLGSWE